MPRLCTYSFSLLFSLVLGAAFLAPRTTHAQATDPKLVKPVYFGGGSYAVDELQAEEVREWLAQFPNIQYYRITIHSHTDNIGGRAYNQWLSGMRSQTAEELLKGLGIPGHKIEIMDFGQDNPTYSNDTWSGKLANRRVDIIIWPMVL